MRPQVPGRHARYLFSDARVHRLAGLGARGFPRRRRRRGDGGRLRRARAAAAARGLPRARRTPAVRRPARLLAGPRRAAGPRGDHGADVPRGHRAGRPGRQRERALPRGQPRSGGGGMLRAAGRRPDRRRAQHRVARAAARRRPRRPARVRPRPGRAHRGAGRSAQRVGDAAPAAPCRRDRRPAGRGRGRRRAAARRSRPRAAGLGAARPHDRRGRRPAARRRSRPARGRPGRRAARIDRGVGPGRDLVLHRRRERRAARGRSHRSARGRRRDAGGRRALRPRRAAGRPRARLRRAGRHRHRRRRVARAARHPWRRVPAHRRAHGLAARARRDRPADRPRPPRDLPRGPGQLAPPPDHRRGGVRHRRVQGAQRHLRPRPRRPHPVRARRCHEQLPAPRRPPLPHRRRRVRRAARRRVPRPSARRGQPPARCRPRGAPGRHRLDRRRGPAHGGARPRRAGARRPGALLGQGGRPRRRRAGQRRAAAVHAGHRLSAARAGGGRFRRLSWVAARMTDQAHIRNFSIIAHIDHGKSTLADRILEITHTVDPRQMREQVLDSMDLERERGITIKAQAVRVFYEARDGETYQLQLIDTPGHVDFTYEVSRSLAACEGALLVVDASQGVEAQTLANTYLAVEAGLELIPCLNKIDLPGAEPERVAEEVSDLIGSEPDAILRISGKTGEGVTEVLEQLVQHVPPPSGDPDAPPRALIFDSEFDQYRGVIAYIRVVDGTFKKGEAIRAMAAGTQADIDDIGFFTPAMTSVDQLSAGEVGYLITGIKDVTELRVGDTLTSRANPSEEVLPGYREVKPMVFCGLFPIDSDRYPDLRDALEKLTLNDAALSWEPETSDALGFGFRCGFLGLLHMDIVRERLEREYDLDLLATMPSVGFEVTLTNGEQIEVHAPSGMPDPAKIQEIREPYMRASILTPKEYIGAIMELCQEKRGEHSGMHYLTSERVQITYDLPLGEIVLDFFDQLKSRTRGYASLDYELLGMRASTLAKLDVLLAGDPVDALSMIVHRDKAYELGRNLAEKLRERIPRQQYDVPIQAAIGSHII